MFNIDFSKPCHVHFIGIGGISMSGLAEILLDRGFTVSGSDNNPSPVTQRLSQLGAGIMCPQSADNVKGGIDLVVYTAAIHPDNPEFAACKACGLTMITRAELLGAIMEHYGNSVAVAGTHGKTTTTGMITEILLAADKDPTVSIGGMFSSIGGNIRVGASDVFLTEACEYTNSYHEFYPKYNVILNVEEDHMDFFKDIDDIRASFSRFAKNTSNDGTLVIGAAVPRWQELTEGLDCKVVTFGEDEGADYYPSDISVSGGVARFTVMEKGTPVTTVELKVVGRHNITNALASFAITRAMGIEPETIAAGLSRFTGTGRRFEYKGEYRGAAVYDDYAHHPTEIAATISAARQLEHKRLIVTFQPHTYTRTKAFLEDFARVLSAADIVVLCAVYPAREEDIYGVHSDDIKRLIDRRIADKADGCKALECHCFDTFDEAQNFLEKISSTGDLLITMGAGDVVKIGEALLAK